MKDNKTQPNTIEGAMERMRRNEYATPQTDERSRGPHGAHSTTFHRSSHSGGVQTAFEIAGGQSRLDYGPEELRAAQALAGTPSRTRDMSSGGKAGSALYPRLSMRRGLTVAALVFAASAVGLFTLHRASTQAPSPVEPYERMDASGMQMRVERNIERIPAR